MLIFILTPWFLLFRYHPAVLYFSYLFGNQVQSACRLLWH